MKIGILTLHYGFNYGGVLQAFALKSVLEASGYEVKIIDRLPNCFPRGKYRFKRCFAYPFLHPEFTSFAGRFLRDFTASAFDTATLTDICRKEAFDAIIVGSDQVWRKEVFPVGNDYFLEFCDQLRCRRIAYAASLGIDTWNRDTQETEAMARNLKKFDAISVREITSVDLLERHCGVDSVCLLDPVLLAGREAFSPLLKAAGDSLHGKVVVYVLDPASQSDLEEHLRSYPADRLLPLLPLHREKNPSLWSRLTAHRFSVPEWVAAIAGADKVITDSFHGTAFSLLFGKNFAVLENPHRGLARIRSLLGGCSLTDRICRHPSEVVEVFGRGIDRERTEYFLNEERKRAVEFLRVALK